MKDGRLGNSVCELIIELNGMDVEKVDGECISVSFEVSIVWEAYVTERVGSWPTLENRWYTTISASYCYRESSFNLRRSSCRTVV